MHVNCDKPLTIAVINNSDRPIHRMPGLADLPWSMSTPRFWRRSSIRAGSPPRTSPASCRACSRREPRCRTPISCPESPVSNPISTPGAVPAAASGIWPARRRALAAGDQHRGRAAMTAAFRGRADPPGHAVARPVLTEPAIGPRARLQWGGPVSATTTVTTPQRPSWSRARCSHSKSDGV
jgi:hypothetical protein